MSTIRQDALACITNMVTACAELRDIVAAAENLKDAELWIHDLRYIHGKMEYVTSTAARLAGLVVQK